MLIFNVNVAELAERYLRKGSPVYLEGTLQTRNGPTTKAVKERYTTEIVVSRFRNELTLLGGRAREGGGETEIGLGEISAADQHCGPARRR